MKILITGTAGFIGFHLAKRLLERGDEVVGVDNINDYYDVNLKYTRLAQTGIFKNQIQYGKPVKSARYDNYVFYQLDLTDCDHLNKLFKQESFDAVCNLAAQAGVRYSLTNPQAYIDANIQGFFNILECSRHHAIKHLVYASSSSVYGLNQKMPFSVHDNVDRPVSLYAASKKSNELMAHAYSHLFQLPTTGLRFFTVYGPWGRPDMALFIFTKAILEGNPIEIFNHGNMQRDFTYVDDIVEGIVRLIDNSPNPDMPYRVFNIGQGAPVSLMDFIAEIEKNTGIIARKDFLPMQDGDVVATWADVDELQKTINYKPSTSIKEGIKHFMAWYKAYYKVPAVQEIES